MPNPINVTQVFTVYNELVRELKPFIKTDDLKIAFDAKDKVYLIGDDFQEVVNANFASINDIKDVIRTLMAKHRSQYRPDESGSSN